ncbi:MAG TPA: uracil-DNA glycosylase [Ignavibacteriaceae bacterium]
MKSSSKNKIIEALKDQQAIFGDDLFEEKANLKKSKTTASTKEEVPGDLFPGTKVVKEPIAKSLTAKSGVKGDWENSESLEQLNNLICNCTKCILHKGRNKFVFGSGNPNADVMVIGEGPGAEEDKQGLPFVGRAGQLLTDILKAIKFTREEVFIGNIVKCRPPDNRTPLPEEMDTCIPYLAKQIELIKPKVILCLGLTAAK